jgi:hypothetical protein
MMDIDDVIYLYPLTVIDMPYIIGNKIFSRA